MNRAPIDKLIAFLYAIQQYAKDLHYNCIGESFYGRHLFADRIYEPMADFIDEVKEVILLGHNFSTLPSKEYLAMAIELIPNNPYDFKNMLNLMLQSLQHIEGLTGLSKGDDNLIGNIAQNIQNMVGLLNIMYDKKEL